MASPPRKAVPAGDRPAARRRTYEYGHHYGIRLDSKAVPPDRKPAPAPKKKT